MVQSGEEFAENFASTSDTTPMKNKDFRFLPPKTDTSFQIYTFNRMKSDSVTSSVHLPTLYDICPSHVHNQLQMNIILKSVITDRKEIRDLMMCIQV